MKKRIITLLAILAVMVACLVISANATVDTSGDWKCPCCDKAYSDIEWLTYGVLREGDSTSVQYSFSRSNDDGKHYLVTGNYNGNLGGDLTFSDTTVILFGKSSGNLVFGTAKNKRTFKVQNNSTVYMIGDGKSTLFSAGYSSATTGNTGGVMYIGSGSTVYMENLTVALQLGNQGSGQLTAVGGAKNGGLINNGGQLTMKNVTLKNGVSYVNAGGIYNTGTLTMENVSISNCVTSTATTSDDTNSLGGALENDGGTVTMTNCTITGGASNRGGAIANKSGTMTIEGGTITGGGAVNRGGAIYITGSASNVKIKDATINGNAGTPYGGICLNGGSCTLYGTTQVIGTADSTGDSVAITAGTLTLSGSTIVRNTANTYSQNIWLWKNDGTCKVQVDRAWTGSASITITNEGLSENHGGYYAKNDNNILLNGTVDADLEFTPATGTDSHPVNLFVENSGHENPRVNCYGPNFVVCRAQLYQDGVATGWYLRPQDAFDDYRASTAAEKYIKLWANYTNTNAGEAGTTWSRTYYVDLNGRDQTDWALGSNGKVYVFDSKASVGGAGAYVNVAAEPVTQINGKTYVAVANGTKYYTYPIAVTKAELTGVTLRPGLAGMYFTAESAVTADAAITDLFYTGVAVSVNNIETSLDGTAWTATQGFKGNGILVQNILKDDLDAESAATRAAQNLYAEACVTIKIGEDYHLVKLADENIAGLNLNNLVSKVAEGYNTLGTQQKYFYDFVTKWQKAFGLWSTLELDAPTTEA